MLSSPLVLLHIFPLPFSKKQTKTKPRSLREHLLTTCVLISVTTFDFMLFRAVTQSPPPMSLGPDVFAFPAILRPFWIRWSLNQSGCVSNEGTESSEYIPLLNSFLRNFFSNPDLQIFFEPVCWFSSFLSFAEEFFLLRQLSLGGARAVRLRDAITFQT